jgi:conjugative transfer region protein (TIGR03748 family)
VKRIAITLTLVTVSSLAAAADQSVNTNQGRNYIKNVGGYTQVKLDTKAEQKYPLLQTANINIPSSIKYIGQAINYVIAMTGYELQDLSETKSETLKLYSLKLPLNNRNFAYATTMQIIQTLIGTGYEIQVDELTRTINIIPS